MTEQQKPMTDDIVTVEELNTWLGGLSRHDLMNYQVLINLKDAIKIVAQMPEGEYKRMTIAGLGFRLALQEAEKNLKKRKKTNA